MKIPSRHIVQISTKTRHIQRPSFAATRQFSTRAAAAKMTDPASYKFNHTMIRVKDPKKSLNFYQTLGMSLLNRFSPDPSFTLYFLGFEQPGLSPSAGRARSDRQGLLELTHNHGSETDPDCIIDPGNGNVPADKDGNRPDRTAGYGHIGVTVDDAWAACDRLSQAGYSLAKELGAGKMKDIAFVRDPDGYWVEIIGTEPTTAAQRPAVAGTTDTRSYRFNHTMLRVKNARRSLDFYTTKLGMTLFQTGEYPDMGFNLYYLGYPAHQTAAAAARAQAERHEAGAVYNVSECEGVLELVWNYGTEEKEGFEYHNGNTGSPQGFGHICLSVDDLEAACAKFDLDGVRFKKKLTEGRMKNIAFLLDPDGYMIEVIQNEALKG